VFDGDAANPKQKHYLTNVRLLPGTDRRTFVALVNSETMAHPAVRTTISIRLRYNKFLRQHNKYQYAVPIVKAVESTAAYHLGGKRCV
jgi:hypothetical protein